MCPVCNRSHEAKRVQGSAVDHIEVFKINAGFGVIDPKPLEPTGCPFQANHEK